MSTLGLQKRYCIFCFGLLFGAIRGEYIWQPVTSVTPNRPQGVFNTLAGPPQQPFPRPPPRTLDANLLVDFEEAFNLMQDVHPTGDNMFTYVSDQNVASIPMGFIEGEGGLVYDAAGHVYHLPNFFVNRTNTLLPLPQHTPLEALQQCSKRYPRLATIIQRYGHMYYHFLLEALPRVVLLQEAGVLTPDTKILTWGQPYEAAWLSALGVSSDQLVPFDPEAIYCADEVLVPTPIARITPPREALDSLRVALGVHDLPAEQRNTILYVSRSAEPTRAVANEAAVLRAISSAFPSHPLVVFNGTVGPEDAIKLFQRARVVIGPHGAGLSHILFAAPGTAVVEFIFMADPPLMFWHAASALKQEYWMLPIPQSYYMQPAMLVPEGEVVDILTAALQVPLPDGACPPGTSGRPGGHCAKCPPGSYAYNPGSSACKLCTLGRVSDTGGATACSTCKPGTYSNLASTACTPCPDGTFSVLAGSGDVRQCLAPEDRRRRLSDQALSVEMLTKLSPVFAKQMQRRALVQDASQPMTLSQQELCAAHRAGDATAGPYLSGPYMIGTTLCPPSTGVAVPTPPPFGTVDIPPVHVGLPLPNESPIPSVPDPNGNESTKGEPQPDSSQPETIAPKRLLDAWVIALIAVAAALVAIPLLVCMGIWCVSRRRRTRQARAEAAAAGSGAASGSDEKSIYKVSNPVYNLKASSATGSPSGSRRGDGKSSKA